MPSDKPRISTYTDIETIEKFKIISQLHGTTMSKYLEEIIKREISYYPIQIDSEGNTTFRKTYLLHNLIFLALLNNFYYFIRSQQTYIINRKKKNKIHLSRVTHLLT